MNAAPGTSLHQALHLLRERLDGCARHWLVGGSCGLLLQGVALAKPPRDIDMYANADAAGDLHELLRPYTVEQPAYSETPIYRSTLSRYELSGYTLELVGGFVVLARGCEYRVDVELLLSHAEAVPTGSGAIGLMPLGHELLFNILRGRPDRYEAIADRMRHERERHLPVLRDLLARGQWSDEVRSAVRQLLEE